MLSRKVYADRGEERRDLTLGALGWILVNGLLLALIVANVPASVTGDPNAGSTVGNVALVGNLAALVLFGYFRRFVALGMLAAMAGLLGVAVIVGVIAAVVCVATRGGG